MSETLAYIVTLAAAVGLVCGTISLLTLRNSRHTYRIKWVAPGVAISVLTLVLGIIALVGHHQDNSQRQVQRWTAAVARAQQAYFERHGRYTNSEIELYRVLPALAQYTMEGIPPELLQLTEDERSVTIISAPSREFSLLLRDGQLAYAGCEADESFGCEDGQWRLQERFLGALPPVPTRVLPPGAIG